MLYPSVFVNHGGGPLPLMGQQPDLVAHMKEVREKWLPKEPPKAIVMVSAHWESNPVRITGSANPPMLFDYYGFPPETYKYQYPAPGDPQLATKIQNLLSKEGIESDLDKKRGYDHGVFIPLMLMFPEANIPVVCVSLHSSLSMTKNLAIGKALSTLRQEGVLIVGSGYTFHNMQAFLTGHKTGSMYKQSSDFNEWLKETMLGNRDRMANWQDAPGARFCHPREEHLLPLFVTAAAAGEDAQTKLIYEEAAGDGQYAVSSYLFA